MARRKSAAPAGKVIHATRTGFVASGPHVAPKATASEIRASLGITDADVSRVAKMLAELEERGKLPCSRKATRGTRR